MDSFLNNWRCFIIDVLLLFMRPRRTLSRTETVSRKGNYFLATAFFFLPLWLSPLRKSLFVSLLLHCQWNWMILAVSAFLMNIVKHMDAITSAQNLFTLLARIHLTPHKKTCFVSFQSYSFLLNTVKGRQLTGQIGWNSAWMVHSFTSVGTLNDCLPPSTTRRFSRKLLTRLQYNARFTRHVVQTEERTVSWWGFWETTRISNGDVFLSTSQHHRWLLRVDEI